jgi:hypothetical protein
MGCNAKRKRVGKLASGPRGEVILRKEKEMEWASWRLLAQNSCRRKKDLLFNLL